MRRTAFIGCLIILNLAFSQAVFLKKPTTGQFNIFASLQKAEKSEFGKRIMDTIALQLTNKVPLADVAQVLASIKSDLEDQQATADTLHAAAVQNCNEEKARFQQNIEEAAATRDDANENINILNNEIAELIASIANKDRQLEILSQRVSSLQEARVRDAEAYNQRVQESTQVLEALILIVEKLGSIHAEDSVQSAFVQLAKIGKSNPILSLVSIASTFSQESLDNVLSKLNGLISSLQTSLEDDKADEAKAIFDYQSLLGELNTTISNLTILRANLSNELSQKEASHRFHTKRYNDAVESWNANTDALAKKIVQCNEWQYIYDTETAQRNGEIGIVSQVQTLIATKLETMKEYLKQRAEQ